MMTRGGAGGVGIEFTVKFPELLKVHIVFDPDVVSLPPHVSLIVPVTHEIMTTPEPPAPPVMADRPPSLLVPPPPPPVFAVPAVPDEPPVFGDAAPPPHV